MRRFFFLILMAYLLGGTAFSQTPAPGTVHASVSVSADPSNSYALYLPSGYTAAKRWPLLLVFDPFARGETSVKLFHDAAEKYGFIVVGSNNSRNFQDPSNAIRLLWTDVKERYAIDPKRLYTAGLSGGARVASSVALACKGCVAGVIANSAGLPQGASVLGPEVTEWFLVAGTTDFNYPEMLQLKEALDARNSMSRFVVYDGPHNWMPPDFAGRAVAWLQLRAMVKGLTAVNKDFVSQQFDLRLAEAQAAQKSGETLAAVRAYREIAADFKSFREVKEQDAAAKSLAESEEFRKAQKNEKAALDLQGAVATKAGDLVAGISQGLVNRTAYFSMLQTAVLDIRSDQRGAHALMNKQAIDRGLASAFAFAVESGQQAML